MREPLSDFCGSSLAFFPASRCSIQNRPLLWMCTAFTSRGGRMRTRLNSFIIPFALGLAVIFCATAMSQVSKGSISGTVTDPQGAVVKGAKVQATEAATGNVRTETTDNAGFFRFNLIPEGTYTVEVSASGFQTIQQKGISVIAARDTGLGSLKLS